MQDNVFVGDSSPRIQKFTNDGVFISAWGSAGGGNGQFAFPRGLSTDETGNVYVADRNLHRMQKFTGAGAFLTIWGSFGGEEGQFNFPYAVRAAENGIIYVSDSSNHRVQKFRGVLAGDLNCDGQINAFDIEPFLLALFDPDEYPIRFPDCDINLADLNGDGNIDAFDIEPFLEALFSP